MKRWSKGYELLRWYVRFAFWLTHKKIVVVGEGNIPQNQPIIFAANHQNALMDPLALVCTNPLQTLWLARADIFKSKFTQPILRFLKMVPIYRIRDGKDNLTNNEQIFRLVTGILEDKQSIALFPEAAHSGKRQMLQHKKAIPRIALDTEAKNNFQLGLKIVPVGIYYDHYWNFNRTLIVQYGEAIGISHYRDEYYSNPQNAMLMLRDEIHAILRPLTLQIDSPQNYSDCENLRELIGQDFRHEIDSNPSPEVAQLKEEQRWMDLLYKLEVEQPSSFQEMIHLSRQYQAALTREKMSDKQLLQFYKTSWIKLFFQAIGAFIALPVLIFGTLFNALPYLIPRKILTRKVKDPAFRSTFIFVVGLLLFPLFYLLEMAVVWIFAHSFWVALATLIAMPFAGKLAYRLTMFSSNLLKMISLKLMRARKVKLLWESRTELVGRIRMLKK